MGRGFQRWSKRTVIIMSLATPLVLVVDMCLYKDDRKSTTPVFPPEDLEYGRVKSKDGEGMRASGVW